MEYVLLVLTLLVLTKLLLWLPGVWPYHRQTARYWLAIEVAVAASFLIVTPGLWSILFAVVSLYQLGNLARLIRDRMQANFLRRASLRSVLWLSLVQILFAAATMLSLHTGVSLSALGFVLATLGFLVSLSLVSSTQRHLKTTKTLQAITSYADRDLPSLSVLLPARNETDDLHACLETLVGSTYPKLEIIVLDDCSQDKHTPEIIRGFAHSGVRFIAGKEPSDNWLAKNYAYEQLAEAASGDYLLFCGVDLRLSPEALRELITTMLEKQKSMLSVLPHNNKPADFRTYALQPVRYAWELSLPRRLFNRPPVLSTCWIIKRSALQAAGSFKAASRSIIPESYFARSTSRSDGYSFLRSNLLVSSKSISEQLATTIRMRYPQLHRRPELVLAVSAVELISAVLSLPLALIAFTQGAWLLGLIGLSAYILNCVVYFQVTGVMYGRFIVAGFALMPLAALYDLLLLHYSMYRYEFREVNWKERNICLPVMRFDPATPPAPAVPNRG